MKSLFTLFNCMQKRGAVPPATNGSSSSIGAQQPLQTESHTDDISDDEPVPEEDDGDGKMQEVVNKNKARKAKRDAAKEKTKQNTLVKHLALKTK